jgi:heme oxygenase
MLNRLTRETASLHKAADEDRLSMLGFAVDRGRYAAFLTRVYGFEAQLDVAIVMTDGLTPWIDLRDRGHLRLLRADLEALGNRELDVVPRCPTVLPFQHPAEALGWSYAIERNTLLHGTIERHLRARLPDVLNVAGAYLAGQQRSNGERMRDLGSAMDRIAKDPCSADTIVAAARAAFRMQHRWYAAMVPRQRVA